MSFDQALRLTEILMALAFIQQSLEHLPGQPALRPLFILRILLCLALLGGMVPILACLGLLGISMVYLSYFQGPYNGGSDRMSILMLFCLCLTHMLPDQALRDLAFGYLAIQVMLSYLISGWVKLINPHWRLGRALQDVFLFSAYPVSESLRAFADRPRLLFVMSWAVISLELIFPLTLLHPYMLITALCLTALFHLANACLFGLNRFFWIWLAAYPSLLWLQQRLFASM